MQNDIDRIQLEKAKLADQVSRLSIQLDSAIKNQLSLVAKQDSAGVSSESFGEVIRSLQSQAVQLKIDLAGLEARRNFLQQASTELGKENNDNGILRPLQRTLQLAQENHKRLSKSSSPPEQVREAELNLLETEVRLAEAKQEAKQNNPQLSKISNQMFETSLERAEKTARLAIVQDMLNSITEARTDVEMTGRISQQVDGINQSLSQRKQRLTELESELASAMSRMANERGKNEDGGTSSDD